MTQRLQHILCVDDDQDVLHITKMALETMRGIYVSTCSSGEQAIERVQQLKPDMIILDVMMPGIDGPTTYCQLKTQSVMLDVPIAFMTSRVQPKEVACYMRNGAVGVISKPFDPIQLKYEVEGLWQSFHKSM